MFFFFSSRRRHTRSLCDWSSDVCSSDLFTTSASQISARLIHAGFVVRDRAAEDKFYKDILGFHVYWHGGMKDEESNWVDMQVPDGTDWLEYMLNVPARSEEHTSELQSHSE